MVVLTCGCMALWCTRKYQEYFVRERDAFDVPDIIAGELYYGMIKEREDDTIPDMMQFIDQESSVIISERSIDTSKSCYGPNEITFADQKSEKSKSHSEVSFRYTGGTSKNKYQRMI